MGELLLQLRRDNMKAMKEHDTLTKGVLSLVIAAITLAEKEAGHTLEKNDELAYIQREIKQTNETIDSIPENREDLKEEAQKKLALLSSYLPKQLTEEEIHQIIEGILQEKGLEPLKRNQGPVMREILDKYKGQTDGKTVNLRLFGSKFVICRTTSAASVIPATGGTKAVEPGILHFTAFSCSSFGYSIGLIGASVEQQTCKSLMLRARNSWRITFASGSFFVS